MDLNKDNNREASREIIRPDRHHQPAPQFQHDPAGEHILKKRIQYAYWNQKLLMRAQAKNFDGLLDRTEIRPTVPKPPIKPKLSRTTVFSSYQYVTLAQRRAYSRKYQKFENKFNEWRLQNDLRADYDRRFWECGPWLLDQIHPAIITDALGDVDLQDPGAIYEQVRKHCIPTQPFRFLDLPAELRINVYRHAIKDDPVAHLSRNVRKRQLLTDCRFVGVSKQLQSEFLNELVVFAPVIRTSVRNFNFGHVIAFANHLTDEQAAHVRHATSTGEQEFKIELYFPDHVSDRNLYELQRWINHAARQQEKGSRITFLYEWDGVLPQGTLDDYDGRPIRLQGGGAGLNEWQKIKDAAPGVMKRIRKIKMKRIRKVKMKRTRKIKM